MPKLQPLVTRSKNPIRKNKTNDVLPIQRENGNGTKNTWKKWHLQKNKMNKERNRCGYRSARTSKDVRTKGRGFNRSIKMKTKQNRTKITPEKDVMASANQTPGGYKFAPLVASTQGRTNQHERACFRLSSPWFISVTFGDTSACRNPALACSAATNLAMKCSAPCSVVLFHFPSSWAASVHWSALMPKALRSSRKLFEYIAYNEQRENN